MAIDIEGLKRAWHATAFVDKRRKAYALAKTSLRSLQQQWADAPALPEPWLEAGASKWDSQWELLNDDGWSAGLLLYIAYQFDAPVFAAHCLNNDLPFSPDHPDLAVPLQSLRLAYSDRVIARLEAGPLEPRSAMANHKLLQTLYRISLELLGLIKGKSDEHQLLAYVEPWTQAVLQCGTSIYQHAEQQAPALLPQRPPQWFHDVSADSAPKLLGYELPKTMPKSMTALWLWLYEQAASAIDYRSLAMGWHYPDIRGDYIKRSYSPFVRWASLKRQEQSKERITKTLIDDASFSSWCQCLIQELGCSSSDILAPFQTELSPKRMQALLNHNLFLPLRALNETVIDMQQKYPVASAGLQSCIDALTAHSIAGQFASLRENHPLASEQLKGLVPAQKQQWQQPSSYQSDDLSAFDCGDEFLFWATKIGGPSHGFDYGGHCLLPLLCNVRQRCILVGSALTGDAINNPTPTGAQFAFTPHNPVARAYLRLLHNNDGSPVLYLEPMQVDFAQFEQVSLEALQIAILRQAVHKSKQMKLPLSLDTEHAAIVQNSGSVSKPQEQHLRLAASAGILEASDTLCDRHDWVHMEAEEFSVQERIWFR